MATLKTPASLRPSAAPGAEADLPDCADYRMLAGDMAAVNAFRREYMEQ